MINTSPLPLGCAKQRCQTSLRATQPATGNGNGKKSRRCKGTAASEEKDLLEEASPVPCAEGNPARDNQGKYRPRGLSQGVLMGMGWGATSEGSQLLCSKHAVGSSGSQPQQPLSSQASSRRAPPSIPANTTQGALSLSLLNTSQQALESRRRSDSFDSGNRAAPAKGQEDSS